MVFTVPLTGKRAEKEKLDDRLITQNMEWH